MTTHPSFAFLPQGAIIQSFKVDGHNIVLGFSDPEPYQTIPLFFGETIGRVANRIKDGKIQNLNGKSYQLTQNDGPNALHGGQQGWGKKQFQGPYSSSKDGKDSVKFVYVSPDGEEGYPGTVELRVWYTPSEEVEGTVKKTVLTVEYEAELVGDECDETILNVTNHSYFTVSEAPTITGTECTLSTSKYMVVDDLATPNGDIADFPEVSANQTFTLGDKEPDIDHCFILDPANPKTPIDTRGRKLQRLAYLHHPQTQLHLEVLSTEPAFQFYTGKFVDVAATDKNPSLGPRCGICIEPSRYVNAVNVPAWREQVVLRKGQTYGARNVYKGWKS